ncbi:MAG TPA: hypothetical protein VFB94_12405 [Acidimicrobiales bacterium]|nr:hypothetical protein [Acidimicrobiales bacterium]
MATRPRAPQGIPSDQAIGARPRAPAGGASARMWARTKVQH